MVVDQPILITGAGGQLGKAFSRLLPQAHAYTRGQLDMAEERQIAAVLSALKPMTIINTSAFTKVDLAEVEVERAQRVNADAPAILASIANSYGALLIHFSTDYVFDGLSSEPYKENDATKPVSVYGQTKLQGEMAASTADKNLIVRTSWVFGQGSNFIRSILHAARTHKELKVVADQTGLPTYAPDLATGTIELLDRGARGLYHLSGGGSPCTWADLAEAALEFARVPVTLRRVSTEDYFRDRKGPIARRPLWSVLDSSKAKRLGVELREWRQAVFEFVEGETQ